MELYKKYRPTKFSEVVGQGDAVRMLQQKCKSGELPHTILLHGPSGCGKTTIGRILRARLECEDCDYAEFNCADFRGIDTVREIRSRVPLAPLGGKTRIWLIDECHKLTGDAQNAFLKLLEDTPSHVYFFLATTEPGKLIATVQNRCMQVKLVPVTADALNLLLDRVTGAEQINISVEVQDKIIDLAEGSARKALVLLDKIKQAEGEDEQLLILGTADFKSAAIEVARALAAKGTTWSTMSKILKTIPKEEDAEGLRRMVLGWCNAVLLGGGPMAARCFTIIDIFKNNFFDSGMAGFTHACYDVIQSK